MFFLSIMGMIFLVLLAVFAVVMTRAFFRFRRASRREALIQGMTHQPVTIHMEPTSLAEIENEESLRRTDLLLGVGLKKVDDFDIPEMGVYLRALQLPGYPLFALLYTTDVGLHTDVVVLYADQTSFTVSNYDKPPILDQPPWKEALFFAEADETKLVSIAREQMKQKPLAAVDASNFAATFEDAYTREMYWRLERGGPQPEEIRRAVQAFGLDLEETERDFYHGQDEAYIMKFLEDSELLAHEWEQIRYRIHVIRNDLPDEELASLFEMQSNQDLDESLYQERRTVIQRFEDTNALLDEADRYQILGRVSQPRMGLIILEPEMPAPRLV